MASSTHSVPSWNAQAQERYILCTIVYKVCQSFVLSVQPGNPSTALTNRAPVNTFCQSQHYPRLSKILLVVDMVTILS